MVTRELISDWLKSQLASERSFARALRRFFEQQAERVADATTGIDLTPSMVPLIFHAANEHAALMRIVRPNLAGMMVAGAKAELAELARRRKRRKFLDPFDAEVMEAFDLDAADVQQLFWEGVPAAIKQRIRHAVDESTQQPYWRAIQDNVAGDIGDVIKQSIDDGISGREMARRIADEMGDSAIDRAQKIATTESTGALNAGHDAAIADAAESGDDLIVGRQWLAVGDKNTRQTHMDADGQIVKGNDLFRVGADSAPYPGWYGLSAAERVGCRCTCIGAFADDS
jgi:hypothetical protein